MFQFEVGLQHFVVQVKLFGFQLFGIVRPVPRLQLEVCPVRVGVGLHLGRFVQGRGAVGFQQLVEQVVHVLGIPGHAVYQHVVGIRLVAEQVGHLQAFGGQLLHDVAVVVFPAQAQGVVGRVQFAAQVAVVGILHYRAVAGGLQRDDVAVLLAGLLGVVGQAFQHEVGQAGEQCLVRDVQAVAVGGLQGVLRELQRQQAQFLRQFAVRGLVRFGQVGAAAHEAVIRLLEQHLLFLIQFQFVFLVVHGFYALEEAFVQVDGVGVFRHFGRKFLRQGLQLVVGFRAEEVVERAAHFRQQAARAVQGHDGVLESRCFRIVHYRVDFLAAFLHSLFEGRHVMLYLDFVERDGAVRRVVLTEERVGRHGRRQGHCTHKCCQVTFNHNMVVCLDVSRVSRVSVFPADGADVRRCAALFCRPRSRRALPYAEGFKAVGLGL